MGGAVRAVTAPIRAVSRGFSKATGIGKGRWKEKGKWDKKSDKNRLAYQWDAKRKHDAAKERASVQQSQGAFRGELRDYGQQAAAATAASAALQRSSVADANRAAEAKANALAEQIRSEQMQRAAASEAAASRIRTEAEANVAAEQIGKRLTKEEKIDEMAQKLKADRASRGTNIFGQSKGIELRPGSAEYIEEMEKRKKLAGQKNAQESLQDFLERMKRTRQGEGDRVGVNPPGGGLVGIGTGDGSAERPFL